MLGTYNTSVIALVPKCDSTFSHVIKSIEFRQFQCELLSIHKTK